MYILFKPESFLVSLNVVSVITYKHYNVLVNRIYNTLYFTYNSFYIKQSLYRVCIIESPHKY